MTARALALLPTPGDLRAALPLALIVAAAITLVALRPGYAWPGSTGFGDAEAGPVLHSFACYYAGATLGGWLKSEPKDAILLILGVVVVVVETICLFAGRV